MGKNNKHYLIILVLFFSILFFFPNLFADENVNFLFSFAKDFGMKNKIEKNKTKIIK